jgi:hypothetical protein
MFFDPNDFQDDEELIDEEGSDNLSADEDEDGLEDDLESLDEGFNNEEEDDQM